MMGQTFLHSVAQDLITRFGTDLKGVTIVFPGKRAGLFLNQELAQCSQQPVWAPRSTTMSQLFCSLSDLHVADPIDSICMIYRIYSHLMENKEVETLDKFWTWAEVILADFDDIDKHMADAESIFRNVYDLHVLDSIDYLTSEQTETLKHFFQHFSVEGNSALKERFLRIWSRMYRLYQELKTQQQAEGILFEGALFRSVAESLQADDSTLDRFLADKQAVAFVGFNVLNDVEKTLMRSIAKSGKALFYWDYDVSYVEDHRQEAGTFMRSNLQEFPSALPADEFHHLARLQDVTFISCTSDNAAARYAGEWQARLDNPNASRNAVVLCNEALLQPVVHALPPSAVSPNITMGFPLADTPVYSLLMALISLQTDGYDTHTERFLQPFVQTVRHHAYANWLSESDWLSYQGTDTTSLLQYLCSQIESVGLHYATVESPNVYQQLYIEGTFQTVRILKKFLQLTQRTDNLLQIRHVTLRRLLRSLLCSTSIPFHGEPTQGLQIMGVLETRCLDFSNLLMLSVEEGMLPRSLQSTTMIPANVREAFGLTTQRHRMAVFAYYFYRLIQRASHLTCVYNENCVGTSRHEMSRFLRQMLAETSIPIRTLWLRTDPTLSDTPAWSVQKTPAVLSQMRHLYDTSQPDGRHLPLSPSAINVFMQCPLRFYLQHIAHLRTEQDTQEGLQASHIGDIFHDTAMLLYQQLADRADSNIIPAHLFNTVLNNMPKYVEPLLDIVFDAIHFHPIDRWQKSDIIIQRAKQGYRPQNNKYTGELIIIRRVILRYLRHLLLYDARHAPIHIVGMEVERTFSLTVTPEGQPPVSITTGGRIDRLDIVSGRMRVVDYKTGNRADRSVNSMEHIILPGPKHQGYFLQTFLYSLAVLRQDHPTQPVQPLLFFTAHAASPQYDPTLLVEGKPVEDFATQLADDFTVGLEAIVAQLFDSRTPFHQTQETAPCAHCDFRLLCGR